MSVDTAIERWMAAQRSAWQGIFERMLADAATQLRSELAVQPQPAPTADSDALRAALQSIYEASAQVDVLTALLDSASRFSSRCALFVLRGTSLSAYNSRNFANDSARGLSFDAAHGVLANAVLHNMPVTGAAGEIAPELVARTGGSSSAWAVPLSVRDRTVALLYADAGTDGSVDGAALQILTRSAGLWLETIAARRAASVPVQAAPTISAVTRTAATTAASTHTPAPAVVVPAHVAPPPVPQVHAPQVHAPQAHAVEAPAAVMPAAEVHAVVAPAPSAAPIHAEAAPAPPVSAEDELQRKARRFAKLLVDEIKLYNPAKVSEGKQHGDLYMRLREDIDKSRETFRLRYGTTPAWSGGCFEEELVRNLADGDRDAMGSAFHYSQS
ncbi:MAG TPA: hypothetical protein VGC88_01220 [Terriglobales bacterium]|jgi:hypothetical protein